MRKLTLLITGILTFFSFASISSAEYAVVPGPPFERQFLLEALPGESTESSVIIKNLGNEDLELDVYAADATNSNLGTFALTTRSTEQRHIGTWAEFESGTVTVPAQDELTVPFTINVPENATPGNYAGGVAVEASSREINPYDDESAAPEAVSISARIITKLFLSVPGDKIHDYAWTDFSFEQNPKNGHHTFSFGFTNDGNTIVLAEPTITISGFPPTETTELKLPQITLQPGTELSDITKKWENIPVVGLYTANATILFSELDIIRNEKINQQIETRSITINLTPDYIIAIIGGAALILLLILIVVIVRKILFRKSLVRYAVQQGDTLASIAKSRNTDWKKIAKINKIKSPYTITVGQKLLVPPGK